MPPLSRRAAPPAARTPAPIARETSALQRSRVLYETKAATIGINKDDLDFEFVKHPQLYNDVAQELALAESYRDDAEARKDQAAASADHRIRRDNAAKGDKAEKMTVDQIKAKVALSDEVVGATAEYNEWKLLAKRWSGLSKSFDQRGSALKGLSQLWLGGYYATASGGRARTDAGDRIAAEVRRAGTGLQR